MIRDYPEMPSEAVIDLLTRYEEELDKWRVVDLRGIPDGVACIRHEEEDPDDEHLAKYRIYYVASNLVERIVRAKALEAALKDYHP